STKQWGLCANRWKLGSDYLRKGYAVLTADLTHIPSTFYVPYPSVRVVPSCPGSGNLVPKPDTLSTGMERGYPPEEQDLPSTVDRRETHAPEFQFETVRSDSCDFCHLALGRGGKSGRPIERH